MLLFSACIRVVFQYKTVGQFRIVPGNVSKALGINTGHTGQSLLEEEIYIAEDDFAVNKKDIIATPRIGVDYAGDDAKLPYRFILKDNHFVITKYNENNSIREMGVQISIQSANCTV